jgi:hypothetical protein
MVLEPGGKYQSRAPIHTFMDGLRCRAPLASLIIG